MVTTAVIAAAGQGSRMYPFSLAVPKELLPVGTVPVIQFVLEELLDSGVTDIIIVLSEGKDAVRAYLHAARTTPPSAYKSASVRQRMSVFVENLAQAKLSYIQQDLSSGVYGTGVPLGLVKDLVGGRPFIYTWADDFILAQPTRFKQLMDVHEKYGVSVLSGVRAQSKDDYDRYAYIESNPVAEGIVELVRIDEKPGVEKAPSDKGVLSGHLFTNDILNYLDEAQVLHKEGEFTFNDVVHLAIQSGEKVYVRLLEHAAYYDCGNAGPYVKTMAALGVD